MTGAKRNGFTYPLPWHEYLRLLRDGIPESLLPYHQPDSGPSDDEINEAGEQAKNELLFGGA